MDEKVKKIAELSEKEKFAILEHLPLRVKNGFEGMTPQQQLDQIKKNEEEMGKAKHDEIQKYVDSLRKKGITIRRVKRMVLKKYKIHIL